MAENLDAVELAMRKFGQWPGKTIPYRMKYLQYFVRGRSEAEMRERAPKEYLQHVEDLRASGRFEDWRGSLWNGRGGKKRLRIGWLKDGGRQFVGFFAQG